MGLAHEKKSYLQEKANLFEIGSIVKNVRCRKVVNLIKKHYIIKCFQSFLSYQK